MSGMLSWQVKSVLLENREHGMMGKARLGQKIFYKE